MAYAHIGVERRGDIGWLWLDRPDKLNALSADMWEDLPKAVSDLTGDDSVRALVVAGAARRSRWASTSRCSPGSSRKAIRTPPPIRSCTGRYAVSRRR